jgi:hypothetical protein
MRAMRRREASDKRANVMIRQPLRQAPLHHALPAAANASYDNDGPIAAALCDAEEPAQRCAAAVLRMSVQIKRCADLKFAASHALFVCAILQR